MIVFADIIGLLKQNGWSVYRLKKEKQMGGGVIERLRNRESITTNTIDTICRLCHCQPGDIITYESDDRQET